ncbi:BnaC05g28900D [Brassica napus]|uniref:BnaC05g28900D protein n=1 Tax=Brassica napus TaxID=3708 RepID=A0A078HZM5_BRANA|nr:BnaC05g28900D [Brassica napus]
MQLSLLELLTAYIQKVSDETVPLAQRQAIPWILWTIWKNRNMILYADTQESLIIQIQKAVEEAHLWKELNMQQQTLEILHGLNEETKKWDPPLPGYVKCNIHANWRNAKLHSGVAFIVRDQSGIVLHHARDANTFSPNRATAELRCLVWTLQSLKDLGYQDVEINYFISFRFLYKYFFNRKILFNYLYILTYTYKHIFIISTHTHVR